MKIDEGNENNNSNNDAESGTKGTILKVLLAVVGLLVGALIGKRLSFERLTRQSFKCHFFKHKSTGRINLKSLHFYHGRPCS